MSRVRIPSVLAVTQWVEYTMRWQNQSGLRFKSAPMNDFIPSSSTPCIFRKGYRKLLCVL